MKRSHEQTVEVRDRREGCLSSSPPRRGPRDPPDGKRPEPGARDRVLRTAVPARRTSSATPASTAVVQFSYETLTRRSRAGRSTVKVLLDTLVRAEVIRCERVNDPARGAAVSVLHLQIHEGAWTAVTVTMAKSPRSRRPGGRLLRDLGLVVVLLELCCEQRAEHGGLRAENDPCGDRQARWADRRPPGSLQGDP